MHTIYMNMCVKFGDYNTNISRAIEINVINIRAKNTYCSQMLNISNSYL